MILPNSDRLLGRVVCASDFSALAAEAANAAAAMALRLREPLVLVPALPEDLGDELPEGAAQWLEGLVRERLAREAARLRKLGAAVEEEMPERLGDESASAFLRDGSAALLVLGASEAELGRRCLAGDAADALAEWSPVTTLLVRTAAPFQAWARGKRPLRVLLVGDPAESSEAALGCVRELRRVGPCEVTVGYALDEPACDEDSDLRVKERLDALMGDESVGLRVMHGAFDVHRRMLELARETEPDLLVVGPPQHHDFTPWPHLAVARAVLRYFPLNLICTPPPRAHSRAPLAAAMSPPPVFAL